jgi:hypothetical protein
MASGIENRYRIRGWFRVIVFLVQGHERAVELVLPTKSLDIATAVE